MDELHTPGPWEVDGVEIYPVAGHRASDAICEMKPGFSHADAILIAAAPELLAALQRMVQWGQAQKTADNSGFYPLQQAREALACATGAA